VVRNVITIANAEFQPTRAVRKVSATTGKLKLLADYLHEHPLPALSVEFTIKDLLPRSEIEFSIGDGDDNFAPHDRTLEMGIRVILSSIVAVLAVRLFGGEFFQPDFDVAMKAAFIVVDEDAGGDVHGIDQAQAFANATFADRFRYIGGDVLELTALRHVEPEFLAEGFHWGSSNHKPGMPEEIWCSDPDQACVGRTSTSGRIDRIKWITGFRR
jgi:hypothetical protein